MLTLTAAVVISLLSIVGTLVFRGSQNLEHRFPYAVPVAIGMFLGVVFFELVPETLEVAGTKGSVAIAVGFLLFYLLAHSLRTYHHHHGSDDDHDACGETKASASLLLTGDAVHNFADGIVLASAFIVSPEVGIATAIAIAFHEIPQEIAEFGVLIRAGYTRMRATLLNLLSAVTIILGALLTMFFAGQFGSLLWVLTGVAAGNLLYIAASDLLPELHDEDTPRKHFFATFLALIIGMVLIVGIITTSHTVFGEV